MRPDSTFFHLSDWGTVVREAYGHTPYRLAAREGDRVVGALPLSLFQSRLAGRRLISMPLADYAGVCASSAEAADLLLQAARDLAVDLAVGLVELRQLGAGCPGLAADTGRVTMVLDLGETPEQLWARLGNKVRNQVRKAEKSELSFKAGGIAEVPAFYEVYARNTRDLGSPMHAKRFFEVLCEVFGEQVTVFTVWSEKAPIGGAIGCIHRDTLEIPWAAGLRQYFSLCPNHLLYWAAMKYGIERGCRTLNFGRSPVGSGPYRFKEQWGAQPLQLYYQYLVLRGAAPVGEKRAIRAYRLFSRLWPQVPMPLAKRLGPAIFRQLPL
jgi:FemAB-related protein (PEP-CTERM system-associated)